MPVWDGKLIKQYPKNYKAGPKNELLGYFSNTLYLHTYFITPSMDGFQGKFNRLIMTACLKIYVYSLLNRYAVSEKPRD